YWAFAMFGLDIGSFVLLYYSLLLIAVLMYFLSFRPSPFAILFLMFFLLIHYQMVRVSVPGILVAPTSRFFPVLSLLPAMHLLRLRARRERPTAALVVMAAVQCFILLFVVFCRAQAVWQVLAIILSGALLIRYRSLWRALRQPRLLPAA